MNRRHKKAIIAVGLAAIAAGLLGSRPYFATDYRSPPMTRSPQSEGGESSLRDLSLVARESSLDRAPRVTPPRHGGPRAARSERPLRRRPEQARSERPGPTDFQARAPADRRAALEPMARRPSPPPTVLPRGSDRRPAILALGVNGVAQGESLVYLEGGDLLVPREALKGSGLSLKGADSVTVSGRPFVSLRSLGLDHSVDEASMTAEITADPEQLAKTRIDLSRSRAPDGIRYREDRSLFLNYAVHALDTAVSGFAEAGLRAAGALIHGSVAVSDAGAVRGPSQVTWENREELRRIVAGDEVISGGALGSGGFIGGVHLIRSFELDPYLVMVPGIDLASSVSVPSTADIYVDGVLVARHHLPPGTFTLDDLPVTSGAGEARVVIRDAFGRERVISQTYYQPAGLLAPGLSDYHVAVGARRQRLGEASFDYGAPAGFARYRRGVTDWLTAGGRAEASLGLGTLGATLAASSRIGQIELGVATSHDRGEAGSAASLSWVYTSTRLGISGFVRAVSPSYANLDVRRDDDRALLDGRAQVAIPINHRASIGAAVQHSRLRDQDATSRGSLQGSLNLGQGAALSVSLARVETAGQSAGLDMFANFSVALGGRNRGSVSHSRSDERARSRIEVHRSAPRRGVGARAGAVLGDGEAGFAEIEARTDHGRYRAGYQRSNGGDRVEGSVAGGLVMIGGRAFATEPVDRSFVLVRTGIPGATARLENRPVGRTDSRGDLIVTNVTPYYGNRISVDLADIPADYALSRSEVVLAPPTRGGAIANLPARRLRLVRGILEIDRSAGATRPSFGELAVKVDGKFLSSPIGEEGEFEVDGLPAGRHLAIVRWSEGRCQFRLHVPDSGDVVTRLGKTVCRIPALRQIRGTLGFAGAPSKRIAIGSRIVVYHRGRRVAESRVGPRGQFVIGGVPPAWLRIVVEAGESPCRIRVRVKRRIRGTVDLGQLVCSSPKVAQR